MKQQSYKRNVSNCSYRDPTTSSEAGEIHVCRLLGEISGVKDDSVLSVESDACAACCDSFLPTPYDWNPVVASLLNQLAETVVEADGVQGCTVQKAMQLSEAAIKNLPIVLPEEDDGVDDIQSFVRPRQVSFEELCQVLPLPNVQACQPVSDRLWAIGVTTAPRRQATLSTCLDSLIASGWKHPHLFVDGDVSVDDRFLDLPQTSRPEPIGAWPAWCEALRELIRAYPKADAIAIVQDDSLLPGVSVLKQYMDDVLWPGDQPCIVSMYTSTDDMQSDNVWRALPGVWKFGAVALAFPPDVAVRLLKAIDAGELDFIQGTAGIDTRIGVWAQRIGIPIWHPSPSLVQHIGQVSSVWKRSRAVGLRRADRFIGNDLPMNLPCKASFIGTTLN